MPTVAIIKKDGRRELFNRTKISSGIYRAVEKRPIAIAVIEDAIAAIEREVRAMGEPEISSEQIGEMVISKLDKLPRSRGRQYRPTLKFGIREYHERFHH